MQKDNEIFRLVDSAVEGDQKALEGLIFMVKILTKDLFKTQIS